MRLQTNNSFATTSSQYFRAAFRGGDNGYTFQEAETKEIHLVEDDPRIFGFLVSLRHSGFILCNRCSSRQALTRTFPFDQDIDFLMEVEDFHKLHIFLEKVCLQELSGEVGKLLFFQVVILLSFLEGREAPGNFMSTFFIITETYANSVLIGTSTSRGVLRQNRRWSTD